MRRLSMVATFALLLAVPCAVAQRRGGSMGGGLRMAPAPSRVHVAVNRGFITTAPRNNGVRFITSFGNSSFRNRRRVRHVFFFSGFPFGWWGYNPWLWDPSSFNSSDPPNDQSQQLAQQVNELSNEVVRLRQEQEARAYAPPPQPAAAPVPAKPEPVIFTVLVFQDRHREEIQNYAVVGHTLWIFNQDRARKIPLAQLDLPATSKANDERGVDFTIPR
ncbi:MAG TPA: hypothetical protein VKB77_10040 [Terriglobales bacterium]|nr:hypothetical protein [Terriglobales bacterium]